MKLTVWQGFKLSAWLITSFLIGLMVVVFIIDYKDSSMGIMFYFNIIFIIIFIWIILYLFRFTFKKLSAVNKMNKK